MGSRAMSALTVCSLAACSFDPRGAEDVGSPDGATDAAEADGAGDPDAATNDAAAIDASVIDARLVDASVIDARLVDAQQIDARPIDAGTPGCTGYQAVTGASVTSRYRKVNTLTTWAGASSNCTSDGGFLIIPETPAEAVAIHSFVAPDADSPFYWAGISDTNLDGTWITVLGQTFANPPFASTQPNQRPGEFYILVASNGQFYDYFNNAAQEFACECVP